MIYFLSKYGQFTAHIFFYSYDSKYELTVVTYHINNITKNPEL